MLRSQSNLRSTWLTPDHWGATEPLEDDSSSPTAGSSLLGYSGPEDHSHLRSENQKPKLCHLTLGQLHYLEASFVQNAEPDISQRCKMAHTLGTHEDQISTWFWIRRKKAELQDKNIEMLRLNGIPPLARAVELEVHIHEDDAVTLIPCTELTIGSWRRTANALIVKKDLLAYTSESKRCLTWFIHSSGSGFKMEIPFGIIARSRLSYMEGGLALATFALSHPPTFYLEDETTVSPTPDGSLMPIWTQCNDWTEHHQASTILRHQLIGAARQLLWVVQNLQTTTRSDIAQPHTLETTVDDCDRLNNKLSEPVFNFFW